MTVLIVIVLVCILCVNIAEFFINQMIFARNAKLAAENSDKWREQCFEVQQANKELSEKFTTMVDAKVQNAAFILSRKGITLLPEDWEKRLSVEVKSDS